MCIVEVEMAAILDGPFVIPYPKINNSLELLLWQGNEH